MATQDDTKVIEFPFDGAWHSIEARYAEGERTIVRVDGVATDDPTVRTWILGSSVVEREEAERLIPPRLWQG